jgi:nucleoid-associated protein YgaU
MIRRLIQCVLLCTMAAAILTCASAPKTEPAPVSSEQPAAQTAQPEKATEPAKTTEPAQPVADKPAEQPAAARVTDQEIAAARDALAAAREWGAELYAAEGMRQAQDSFQQALNLRATDPQTARALLAKARESADAARADAIVKYAGDLKARMDRSAAALRAIAVDLFLPVEYASAVAGIDEAAALYQAGDAGKGRERAYRALKEMADLRVKLDEQIRWARILMRDYQGYMQEAETAGASRWAGAETSEAQRLHLEGLVSFQEYRLAAAQSSLAQACAAARDILPLVRTRKAAAQVRSGAAADDMMRRVMKELEEASRLSVVGADGSVRQPQDWTGAEDLKTLPQPQTLLLLPTDGNTTVVLGDVSTEDLLAQAKSLWKLGVAEMAKGDPEKAMEYFTDASSSAQAYKRLAVSGTYTVRLVLEQRDCLWRISGQEAIYGNPDLWPLIWEWNRSVVPNPDLIEPGQILVIPRIEPKSAVDKLIAEACYLVGKQLESLGVAGRGGEFVQKAYILYPQLDPTSIPPTALTSAQDIVVPLRTATAPDHSESARSFFIRFAGALLDGDAKTALECFAGSVYLTDTGAEVDRMAVESSLAALFTQDSARGSAPGRAFNLATVSSSRLGEGNYSVSVGISGTAASIAELSGPEGRFLLQGFPGAWRIAAIGSANPPAGWVSQQAVPVAAMQSPSTDAADNRQHVLDAFVACMTAFAGRDVDAGLRYVANTLTLRRLNTVLTGDERGKYLNGTIGQAELSGSSMEELFDLERAFVESVEGTNPSYRLSVEARQDLSAAVPFWGRYQDYLFTQGEQGWELTEVF